MTDKGRNWGGKRKNQTGRPRKIKTTSEKAKQRWMAAAQKIKKETGETIEYHALKMVLDPDEQGSVKASILKTYNEALIVKETKQDVNVTEKYGPRIGLPPVRRKDPALEVVKGGK